MKTLQQIKDDVAQESGYTSYENLMDDIKGNDSEVHDIYLDEIIKRACNEQKQACLEAAQVETYVDGEIITGRPLDIKGQVVTINRQSILNAKNVGG